MRITGSIFILLLLLEIACFIVVGKLIGVLLTLLLVVLSAVAGFILLQKQGMKATQEMFQYIQPGGEGVPSLDKIPDMLLIIAAILLIIPGFITDTMGLVLLIPAVRHFIYRRLMHGSLKRSSSKTPLKKTSSDHHRVIEGEFKKKDD